MFLLTHHWLEIYPIYMINILIWLLHKYDLKHDMLWTRHYSGNALYMAFISAMLCTWLNFNNISYTKCFTHAFYMALIPTCFRHD
jgi:hypothetical protein